MDGWIKLHRKILESPLWKDCNANQKVIFITCLLLANHESNKWIFDSEEYEVQEGEFITSIKSLSEITNCSTQCVRSCLAKFEKFNFTTKKTTNKNTLIKIENWAFYQGEKTKTTNKVTSKQQANNKQTTTNKNVRIKECKNNICISSSNSIYNKSIVKKDLSTSTYTPTNEQKDKKIKTIEGKYKNVILTLDEFNRFREIAKTHTMTIINRLSEFIHEKNAKVKNHFETLCKWYDQDKDNLKNTKYIEIENILSNYEKKNLQSKKSAMQELLNKE